jgi:hypothetical protein
MFQTVTLTPQELLERNRILDERAASLEYQVQASNDLITQLRHELSVKTELLHVRRLPGTDPTTF